MSILNRLNTIRQTQSDRLFGFMDQALLGAGNLLTAILMARILPTDKFAAFATGVAIYFLLAGFYRAIIVIPFLLSGKEEGQEEHKPQWVWLTVLIGGAAFALMQGVAFGMGRAGFSAYACLVAVFAAWQTPGLLLQEFGRRWLYQSGKGLHVVLSSLLSLAIMLGGLGLMMAGWLSPTAAPQLMGLSALAAFVMQMLILPPRLCRPSLSHMAGLLRPRLHFALWQALTHIPFVIYGQGFPLLLTHVAPPVTLAGYSAIRNVLNPVNSIVSAVDSTDKIRAVNAMRERGVAGALASVNGTRRFILVLAMPWLALSCAAGPWLLPLLYKGRYSYPWEMAVLGLYYLLVVINQPFETFLITNEKGKSLFASRLTSAAVTFGAAAVLVPGLHVMGAVLALVLAQAANCLLLALVSRHVVLGDRAALPAMRQA